MNIEPKKDMIFEDVRWMMPIIVITIGMGYMIWRTIHPSYEEAFATYSAKVKKHEMNICVSSELQELGQKGWDKLKKEHNPLDAIKQECETRIKTNKK